MADYYLSAQIPRFARDDTKQPALTPPDLRHYTWSPANEPIPVTQIEHISDTAKWVAVYRAMETKRPDAIFRDPYAERLAGAQGQAIVDGMKRGRAMAWAMIVRTAVFDEVILERIRNGNVDVVLNLAAGLDARPWRMKLPSTLRWIDVDLPDILDHKTEIMKAENPSAIRGDSSRPRRRDAPAIIVLANQRRLATRARRIGRIGDLSEAGRRRVARPRLHAARPFSGGCSSSSVPASWS